jgi:hypothetical protein
MTEQVELCRFCVYRSLCNRGVQAGALSENEQEAEGESLGFDFDFEQIAEIEF